MNPLKPHHGDVSGHGCVHVMTLKGIATGVAEGTPASVASARIAQDLLESYRVIVRYSLSLKHKRHFQLYFQKEQIAYSQTQRRKVPVLLREAAAILQLPIPKCVDCADCEGRIHFCLQCTAIGCFKEGHIHKHFREKGHMLAVDMGHRMVYCGECKDYVYDAEFEFVLRQETRRIDSLLTKILYQVSVPPPVSVHIKGRPLEWIPSPQEVANLKKKAKIMPCGGLRNMGATCFLNVVLQSFVHNPLLRSFFLGDRHNNNLCDKPNCLACEMDIVFSSVFDGSPVPFGPNSFLHTSWLNQAHLAGYQQQDAHEFFISVLSGLHENVKVGSETPCNCIIHKTFAGLLQSSVTCLKCKNVTTVNDPFLDVSLDIRVGSGSDCTLKACLDKYTRPERLGAKVYSCSACHNTQQEATKQMSFRKLPHVLAVQLKRFEHTATASTKIDHRVLFSEELDMTPYTSRFLNRPAEKVPCNVYELFSVINHTGSLDTGHYTVNIKTRDEWFNFDDHIVRKIDVSEAIKGGAYMLFYMRKYVDFE